MGELGPFVFSITPLSSPMHLDGFPCADCGHRTHRTYYPDAVVDSVRRAVAFDICPRSSLHATPAAEPEETP